MMARKQERHVAVYARVSTGSQDTASQEPDLTAWLASQAARRKVVWYRDTFTGATMDRPGMKRLEQDLAAGQVDTLVVWRLDRLGRTATETLTFLEHLDKVGVRFVSVREGVDPSSPAGRLMRHLLAAFAEYEREIISERIRAGVARAKAAGKKWGGKKPGQNSKLTPAMLKSIEALLVAGVKKAAIARQLGIGRTTVWRAVKAMESDSPSANVAVSRQPKQAS